MALPTTDINTTNVGAALGASAVDNVSGLCAHANVNKWSRYKPLRTVTRPGGDDGKYGFNLPTNWNYLQPLANYRLDDFRGYEHDKDIAGPVIYCLNGDVVFTNGTTLRPTLTDNYSTGEWKHKANLAPHNSVMILPSDLGYGSYYCGVHLTIGTLHFYKTGALVSAIGAGGQVIGFDAHLTNLSTKALEDFPSTNVGTYTWELFISSSQHTAWTQTTPTNYIALPGGSGETWGSKTIKATSTFTMGNWLIAADNGVTDTARQQLTWAYNDAAAKIIRLWRPAGSPPPGINTDPAHWNVTKAEQGGIGGSDVTSDSDAWDDGTAIYISPTGANNSAQITQNIVFGLEITHHTVWGTECTIQLVHEDGTPVSAPVWREDEPFTFGTNVVNSGASIGSTNMNLTIGQLSGGTGFPKSIQLRIYRNLAETQLIHNSNVAFASDRSTTPNQNFTLTSALQPGDQPVIRLGISI